MFRLAVLIALVALAVGGDVEFRSCGKDHGDIKALRVTGCEGKLCTVKRGEHIQGEIDFVSVQDSKTAVMRGHVQSGIIGVDIPPVDICASIAPACPLQNGGNYTFKMDGDTGGLPSLWATVTAGVHGEAGEMSCFQFDVHIE